MRIVVVRGTSLVVVRGCWLFAVVMGGFRGCWAVDVIRWVLAVVRRSLSALRVVVEWAVAVVVFGQPGCISFLKLQKFVVSTFQKINVCTSILQCP